MKTTKSKLRILITTGIYPPSIGGPATYSKALEDEFISRGFKVKVRYFRFEKKLPTGLRHLWFLVKSAPTVLWADRIITLDTFSVAVPTLILAKIFRKKVVIRTGGDFLWEKYLNRTKELVLLQNFYSTKSDWTVFEGIIFNMTNLVVKNVDVLVFSTKWQRDIWVKAYDISDEKIKLIENAFPKKIRSREYRHKNFLWPVRDVIMKNPDYARNAFKLAKQENENISLEDERYKREVLIDKMKDCYAVYQPSLGDISSNLILDAVSLEKPFICTMYTGLYDKLKDVGVFVDPLDIGDIKEKILYLSQESVYKDYKKRLREFDYSHSWREIADEFLDIMREL